MKAPADVAYLLERVEALERVPLNQWEGEVLCAYCSEFGVGENHAPDCPWVRARALVE